VTAGQLDVLRRVRRQAAKPRPGERCDFCSTDIGDDHRHVVDIESRSLLCTCTACTLLFDRDDAPTGHFRAVPREVLLLPEPAITAAQWDSLQIPVGIAFFFRSSVTGEMSAFYPGPAGATESLLPLGAFEEIAAGEPALEVLRPDIEAVLAHRGRETQETYVAPIDRCYELVGLLRRAWRGFDGGTEAHRLIDAFFAALRAVARPAAGGGGRG
jgi:Family of unknown function (DUF5947)